MLFRSVAPRNMRVFFLLALVAIIFGTVECSCPAVEGYCPQEKIYQGCHCFHEWNDANRVGNWTFAENWLQLYEPAWVSFVSIAGDNTVTVDVERRVNELYVGPNRWDTTRLVIDEDLTIVYDDVPAISSVRGYRLPTGVVRLVIQGKGFGFVSDDIQVTVQEYYEIDGDSNIEDREEFVYDCEYVTLTYRDAKIECNISPTRPMPYTLTVQVAANGMVTDYHFLGKYIE